MIRESVRQASQNVAGPDADPWNNFAPLRLKLE
jgi:hypothetical protein